MAAIRFKESDLFGSAMGAQLGLTPGKEETRKQKMLKSRQATNKFQKWVIDYLNDSKQFVAWRSNNIPSTRSETIIKPDGTKETKFHFKKSQIKIALLDVAFFRIDDGKYGEIEIKTGNDTLSTSQKERISTLQKSNCICFVASNEALFKEQIKPYIKERKLAF